MGLLIAFLTAAPAIVLARFACDVLDFSKRERRDKLLVRFTFAEHLVVSFPKEFHESALGERLRFLLNLG